MLTNAVDRRKKWQRSYVTSCTCTSNFRTFFAHGSRERDGMLECDVTLLWRHDFLLTKNSIGLQRHFLNFRLTKNSIGGTRWRQIVILITFNLTKNRMSSYSFSDPTVYRYTVFCEKKFDVSRFLDFFKLPYFDSMIKSRSNSFTWT